MKRIYEIEGMEEAVLETGKEIIMKESLVDINVKRLEDVVSTMLRSLAREPRVIDEMMAVGNLNGVQVQVKITRDEDDFIAPVQKIIDYKVFKG